MAPPPPPAATTPPPPVVDASPRTSLTVTDAPSGGGAQVAQEVFVPGRLCLFGEHSDWSGAFRRFNPAIGVGATLVLGTTQGLYARVRRTAKAELVFTATDNDGTRLGPFTCAMERRARAREAGRRGRLLLLRLRRRPTLLTYDGDRLEVEVVDVAKPILLIIVDLGCVKDTPLMLESLQKSFPGPPADDVGRGVHEWLGPVNRALVARALKAVEAGDAELLGTLMTEAARDFDEYGAPTCPAQFDAPTLHRVLAYEPLQTLTWGGKGVGCGGEGSCQFVARSEAARDAALKIIANDLGLWCCGIDVGGSRGVRRAIIPAAGYHGALFPASHVTPSPLWPVLDVSDGLVKPALMLTIAELVDRAGMEQVYVVIQRGDVASYERALMRTPLDASNEHQLPPKAAAYAATAKRLGGHVHLVCQETQDGLGHAVLCARDFVARHSSAAGGPPTVPDEPFLLVLGDHLYTARGELSCAQQLLAAHAESPAKGAVAVAYSTPDEASHFGVVAGSVEETPLKRASSADDLAQLDTASQRKINVPAFAISQMVEKPDAAEAAGLAVPGLSDGRPDSVLTVFGMYVLPPRVFDYLDDDVRANRRQRGVFGLTSALQRCADGDGLRGIVVDGTRFDFGDATAFAHTWSKFSEGV
ncbi:hypothetical protein JL722_10498 [Aureococcus anophagefferens]|nr:hypothetical protein JL722_10498 [Aureococcus anophagefferens]